MLKKKDTFVIIGNGFDRWQNLDTSYSSFQKYYEEHRDEILDKLGIGKIRVFDRDGSSFDISDVELIYGNPFKPASLDDDFWWRFEDSLATIDAYRINAFFGKDDKGLKEMAKSIDNARHILNVAFASWLESIEIGEEDTGIRFGENCYFINFNYTSTLEKRFCVDSNDIYHIHGEAGDPESIVVGHSAHPQEPLHELYDFGGRFRGLYQVETVLYETDKHVENNITLLSMALAIAGIFNYDIINFNYTSTLEKRFCVDSNDIYHIHGEAGDPESIVVGHSAHPQEPLHELYDFGGRFRGLYQVETVLYETDKHVENNITLLSMALAIAGIFNYDIKDIYVLGHSLGVADIGYFNFLSCATQTVKSNQDDGICNESLARDDFYEESLSDLNNRIQYVIKRYGNDKTITEEISPEEEKAFLKRLSAEQQERNQMLTDDFKEALRESDMFVAQTQDEKVCGEIATEKSPRREQDAMWHITYFSEDDEKRIRGAMELIGCTNYELISSIDEAIKPLVMEKAAVP